MANRLSRRKLAGYVTDKLQAGVPARDALRGVAAYLSESNRTREYELVVRDIEDVLAERGIVVANVTTARPLSDAIKKEVASLIVANDVQLREIIDETVLGGVLIDVPGKRFDGTLRHKLNAIKAKQL